MSVLVCSEGGGQQGIRSAWERIYTATVRAGVSGACEPCGHLPAGHVHTVHRSGCMELRWGCSGTPTTPRGATGTVWIVPQLHISAGERDDRLLVGGVHECTVSSTDAQREGMVNLMERQLPPAGGGASWTAAALHGSGTVWINVWVLVGWPPLKHVTTQITWG